MEIIDLHIYIYIYGKCKISESFTQTDVTNFG